MKTRFLVIAALFSSWQANSQNDLDALRYSQTGVGGNARFVSMGGAFGALGANVGCLSTNPAGIGIYRKGETNISIKLLFNSSDATHNDSTSGAFKPSTNFFNGFGFVGSWEDKTRKGVRHSFGFANNQMQNFNSLVSIAGYNKGKSIINDILNNAQGNTPANLDPFYSAMAYSNYLIDTIYNDKNYYGFIDSKAPILQSKNIDTKGYMNELVAGYTYTQDDKLYLGFSVGFPRVNFSYQGDYTENDIKDSLRIWKDASNNYQSTYSYPVYVYTDASGKLLGGFKSTTYTETFKTTGSGYNLKLGAIYRATEFLRLGIYFHTPTLLTLTDTYSYQLVTTWDGGTALTKIYPENGGISKYRLITPMRFGGSIGYIYKKLLSVGLDYESVNYGQARLNSNTASDFAGVNTIITSKYKFTSNFRTGIELNVKPVFIRAGYNMYGSPFGKLFSGPFVRHNFSGGMGFRNENWTFDFCLVKSYSKEEIYMYNPAFASKSDVSFSGTNFVLTLGCKF